MVRQLLAICNVVVRPATERSALAALHFVLFLSASFAAQPVVVAELDAQRKIAEADSAQASAEQGLADWTLKQLEVLRSRGHASWQEVAQQEVTAKSLAASAKASEQYLQAVLNWQARLTKSSVQQPATESECVRLYLPHSARLVASIATEVASSELSTRHFENLRAEYRSLAEIELSSLETAITKAKKEVEVYGRAEQDADLLHRAELRLRLAKAQYASGQARKESARIIARRMALIQESQDDKRTEHEEPSPALARVGTPLVDATGNHELARWVGVMASDESTAGERVAWLKHQHDTLSARVDALQELSDHSLADPAEIEQANQLKSDLQLEIQIAEGVLAAKRQMASNYDRKFESPPTSNANRSELQPPDDTFFADASTVRHWLGLQQLKFQRAANLAAVEAQRDYLAERLQRVERIDENARPPKELDHLRHKLQGVERQLAMIGRELSALDNEQQRFCCQVKSQQGEQYQLVQADQGKFIGRVPFERGTELISVVSFVGQGKLFPDRPGMFPYIESTAIFDCMSQLTLQAPCGTSEIDGWPVSRSRHDLPRPGVQFCCEVPYVSSGLRLEIDKMIYAKDLFCYRPYGLWRVRPSQRWAPWEYLQPASTRGYRSFSPYDHFPLGSCGRSVFSYRVGRPTRASFPYRSSYLYRTAFPVRSNLYSYPYARPSGLVGCCFD